MDADKERWKEQRFIYELLKQQPIFRSWKKEQFICQTGKCALCQKPMQYRYAETDHFFSLHRGGTSESKNMVLAHHSCNKYKSTKIYSNDLSWIKQNRYAQAVDEKYSSLMNEYGTAEATAIPSPLSSTQLDERTSKTLPENRQTRRNKDSTLKRALLSFGLVCLIAIAPAFVLEILEVAKKPQ